MKCNINKKNEDNTMNEEQLKELYPDSYDIKENQELIHRIIEQER